MGQLICVLQSDTGQHCGSRAVQAVLYPTRGTHHQWGAEVKRHTGLVLLTSLGDSSVPGYWWRTKQWSVVAQGQLEMGALVWCGCLKETERTSPRINCSPTPLRRNSQLRQWTSNGSNCSTLLMHSVLRCIANLPPCTFVRSAELPHNKSRVLRTICKIIDVHCYNVRAASVWQDLTWTGHVCPVATLQATIFPMPS